MSSGEDVPAPSPSAAVLVRRASREVKPMREESGRKSIESKGCTLSASRQDFVRTACITECIHSEQLLAQRRQCRRRHAYLVHFTGCSKT